MGVKAPRKNVQLQRTPTFFGTRDWFCGRRYFHRLEWWGGEGNGTPLQYSCLENPTDGEAWWAVVHGVAKSRT